jgi:hypothetical protein
MQPGELSAALPKVDEADDDRAAYVRALIASRCPELGPADLATLAVRPDPDAGIPPEIADQIMDVLLAFEARLERIENAVRSD